MNFIVNYSQLIALIVLQVYAFDHGLFVKRNEFCDILGRNLNFSVYDLEFN